MTRRFLLRFILVSVMLVGLWISPAEACPCTQCVVTDDGVHGCAVGWGCAYWCMWAENGTWCFQGGSCPIMD